MRAACCPLSVGGDGLPARGVTAGHLCGDRQGSGHPNARPTAAGAAPCTRTEGSEASAPAQRHRDGSGGHGAAAGRPGWPGRMPSGTCWPGVPCQARLGLFPWDDGRVPGCIRWVRLKSAASAGPGQWTDEQADPGRSDRGQRSHMHRRLLRSRAPSARAVVRPRGCKCRLWSQIIRVQIPALKVFETLGKPISLGLNFVISE